MQRELLRLLRQLLRGELTRRRRRRGASVIVVVVLAVAVYGIDSLLRRPHMAPPQAGADLVCRVVNVHDGDTITTDCPQGKLRIRVWGIDAPEIGQRPWGYQSRDELKQLLGRSGQVKIQVVDTDRYGRSVARLFVGNQDLGLAMVRAGRAIVYAHYNDSASYRQAQAQARQARLGIWSQPGSQQDPAAWRHLNSH